MSLDAAAPGAPGIDLDAIDLSDRDFWAQPPAERHAVFDLLRRERPFAFFAEPEVPLHRAGARLLRRHPVRRRRGDQLAAGAVLLRAGARSRSPTCPPDLNEFYGSMISMDDPRHAQDPADRRPRRSRRGCSSSWSARCRRIADDVADRGPADGRGRRRHHRRRRRPRRADPAAGHLRHDGHPGRATGRWCCAQSNIILSGGDPELIEDEDDAVDRVPRRPAMALAGLMNRLAAERLDATRPTT